MIMRNPHNLLIIRSYDESKILLVLLFLVVCPSCYLIVIRAVN